MGKGGCKVMIRVCAYCGKEFVPKQSRSIYCSRECQIRGFHFNRPKGATKKCACCGKEFTTEHRGTKYCSPSCKQKVSDEQRKKSIENRKPKHEAMKCLQCGKEFIPKDKRQIFCSKECSAIHNRIKYQAQAEERKKTQPKNVKTVKKSLPKKQEYQFKKNAGLEDIKPQPKPKGKLSPASQRWAKMPWAELTKELLYYGIRYTDAQLMAKNNTLPKDFGLKRKKAKQECPQ